MGWDLLTDKLMPAAIGLVTGVPHPALGVFSAVQVEGVGGDVPPPEFTERLFVTDVPAVPVIGLTEIVSVEVPPLAGIEPV